jgi:hypothetical protein
MARDVRRQAQNASDASSLAAANALYPAGLTVPDFAGAVAAAKSYAAENYGVTDSDWASCTDSEPLAHHPAGVPACISFDEATQPKKVRVRVPVRDVKTTFGNVLGVASISVGASANVQLDQDVARTCALCIIGPGTHDLQNGDVSVSGGDVHLNGSVSLSSGGKVVVAPDGKLTVEGTASGSGYTPTAQQGVPAILDPLAFLPLPPDMSSLSTKTDPCADGPGKYGAFSFPSSSCTLAPGLYVIAGAGAEWKLSGSSTVTGTGVTLYLTCGTPAAPAGCATGQAGATIDASGGSTLTLRAPTSGPLNGLAVVIDRKSTATVIFKGNGGVDFTGTFYAASGALQMNGNGCGSSYRSRIVVGDVEMNGNPACLTISHAATENVPLPPVIYLYK